MFIQTEATPNPATLKFLPGTAVLGDGTECHSGMDATRNTIFRNILSCSQSITPLLNEAAQEHKYIRHIRINRSSNIWLISSM